MTPAEAQAVLTYAASIDGREASVAAAIGWADTLDPRLSVDDATWIVKDHYRRETWKILPAHINEKYKQVRHDRLKDMRSPEPPQELDGHPARELAWQRAYRTAIGDGQDEAQADRTACQAVSVTRLVIEAAPRPVTAALEGHKAGCRCGCLTRPVRAEEGRERR